MRVVLDANVFVSGIINRSPTSPPRQILDLWRQERFELLVTKEILSEISRVLRYPRLRALHKLSDEQVDEIIVLLVQTSTLVYPSERLAVSRDESDNRYIECAAEGRAAYIVTGDKKHLLPIKEYQGIRIIAPSSFLLLLG